MIVARKSHAATAARPSGGNRTDRPKIDIPGPHGPCSPSSRGASDSAPNVSVRIDPATTVDPVRDGPKRPDMECPCRAPAGDPPSSRWTPSPYRVPGTPAATKTLRLQRATRACKPALHDGDRTVPVVPVGDSVSGLAQDLALETTPRSRTVMEPPGYPPGHAVPPAPAMRGRGRGGGPLRSAPAARPVGSHGPRAAPHPRPRARRGSRSSSACR